MAPEWPGQERPQQAHLDLVIDDIEAHARRAEHSALYGWRADRIGSPWLTWQGTRSTCTSATVLGR